MSTNFASLDTQQSCVTLASHHRFVNKMMM